jgi:hypothetical protein
VTRVGVDFGAVRAGADQVGVASESFGQGSGRVGATPRAAAPFPNASELLERVLEAIADSLRTVASELEGVSAGLTATAVSYERTEQLLANWNVPGGTVS